MFNRWRERFQNQIPAQTKIVLGVRDVYVFPSRFGLIYMATCLVLLLLAINYANSLIYIICFWLTSLFLLVIFVTWQNLVGLHLHSSTCPAIFVGEKANFTIILESQKRAYQAIYLQTKQSFDCVDCNAKSNVDAHLSLTAVERGELQLPRFRLSTTYPLGLISAWTYLDLNQSTLCYPKPIACPWPSTHGNLHSDDSDFEQAQQFKMGVDHYEGLQAYQPSDNINRIHWGAYAKGHGLFIKQFSQAANADTWIDFQIFPGDLETRLSHMCYWVLRLHEQGIPYGLRLGNLDLKPQHAIAHMNACLQALAQYEGYAP